VAWEEWDQLKGEALQRQQGMQLNQYPADAGPAGAPPLPSETGDLRVTQQDLAKIGSHAHTLHNQLWDRARLDNTSVGKAAGDLSTQGFALGSGLQEVYNQWSKQLDSVLDACAQISNHMQVTKKIHAGDEAYIHRQMSSIDTLDAGFDERSGPPGRQNPIYGDNKK
jgi:hypothetical protein